jgi:purine-nucleoside phosphorylase
VRAEPGDFAESVLLPGDPRRAKYVAENFFEDAKLVTKERGMLGYTGTYKGEPISIQATGMGCPSAAIATAATPADGTVSSITRGLPYAPAAHFDVLHAAYHAAQKGTGRQTFIGPIVTSDLFYDPEEEPAILWGNLGVLAVEMEAATIFTIATMRDVKAGCLLTVSNTIGEEDARVSDEGLQNAVDDMVTLALDTLNVLN